MSLERTVQVAIELSFCSWLVAVRIPGVEKARIHKVEGGNTKALLTRISDFRGHAASKLGQPANVACCFEAGRDGFGL